jgi:hypothetical protein
MDILQFLGNWYQEILCFIIWLAMAYSIILFVIRRERRIFQNLSKKHIYFFHTGPNNQLQREIELMMKNKLLFPHVHPYFDAVANVNVFRTIEGPAVLVVGYNADYSHYDDLVNYALTKNYAFVIMAHSREVIPEHEKLFGKLNYFDICNTPARLQTIIFNQAIITPIIKGV